MRVITYEKVTHTIACCQILLRTLLTLKINHVQLAYS